MSHESISIEELATRIGRDRRDVEKLANRGRIPGRKVGGMWQFHPTEIRHWLEHEMRGYSDSELAALEEGQRAEETDDAARRFSIGSRRNRASSLAGPHETLGAREPGRSCGPHVADLGAGDRA